ADSYGPLLDPLWRGLLRLTPVPDDHLADPWVGGRRAPSADPVPGSPHEPPPNSPAARAHRYLAPSTATGFSVVYG
ncbi:hypothetical protein ABZT00_35340, partial [Streptomyces sp. NPDC005486]